MEKRIIGFTGTQRGMSVNQFDALIRTLKIQKDEIIEVHHGDCIGADAEFHGLVRLVIPEAIIIVHPPLDKSKRAFKLGDNQEEEKEYIDRNHDIVDASNELIACPNENEEVTRSGTWATIRYAKKQGKKVSIIYP